MRRLLLLLLLLPGPAGAANHYIRAGATGTADGSDWTNAWTDVPFGLTRGDTYYFAAGSYVGDRYDAAASGTLTITLKKATVADHGTATGWSDTYATGAVAFSQGMVFWSPYWVVDGVTGGGAAGGWSGGFGITVTESRDGYSNIAIGDSSHPGSAHHITISHVDLIGIGVPSVWGGSFSNDGLSAWGGSDITLSYFHMSGIGRCPFFISTANFIAEHGWVESYFENTGPTDIVHSEVASVYAFNPGDLGDVTFRYNLITKIISTGGIMWDNKDNTAAVLRVYGNTFYKPSGETWGTANGLIGGWTGAADCSAEQFKNALVYNNTFINIDQDTLSNLPLCSGSNVAENNLWYNSTSETWSSVWGTHDYNHYINSGGAHSEANGTSAASGDPFTNYTGRDFTLTGATAAGLTLASPFTLDPLGTTLGSDGIWDRGAFDYAPATPLPVIAGSLSKTCFVKLACSYQITASGSPTSYGATGLPSGLSLNTGTGLISGTVTTRQKATVALSATNSGGTGNANMDLTIAPAGSTITPIRPNRRGVRGGDRIGH